MERDRRSARRPSQAQPIKAQFLNVFLASASNTVSPRLRRFRMTTAETLIRAPLESVASHLVANCDHVRPAIRTGRSLRATYNVRSRHLRLSKKRKGTSRW